MNVKLRHDISGCDERADVGKAFTGKCYLRDLPAITWGSIISKSVTTQNAAKKKKGHNGENRHGLSKFSEATETVQAKSPLTELYYSLVNCG